MMVHGGFQRWLVAGALSALLAGAAAAYADTSATIMDAPTSASIGYQPEVIHAAPGSWVTWSNAGADAHTVTAREGEFDSGELLPSEGFSWYFDQEGTHDYYCVLHPWMAAQVVVGTDAAPAIEADSVADMEADSEADSEESMGGFEG